MDGTAISTAWMPAMRGFPVQWAYSEASMLTDRHHRQLQDLRISVTDRCNLRCTYCMPLDQYDWLAREQILSFEEIRRLVRIFAGLGASKLRITGGEPLLRNGLPKLVSMLARIDGIEDICLTTNGLLLGDAAVDLRRAGLDRVTISLDSLNPDTFLRVAQRGRLDSVLAGVAAAKAAGLGPIKINTVVERGVNDREIPQLLEYSRREGFEIRFIEYMDVGNVNEWTANKLVSKAEILDRVAESQPFEPVVSERGSAPAVWYRFTDGIGGFGVIASVTEPFCGDCTRARLTADGRLVTCLFSPRGHDLKALLRTSATDGELSEVIASVWKGRTDRYSEERLVAILSKEGYRPEAVQKLEMISLGG